MPTITGRTKLPGGTTPLLGTWRARIHTDVGAAIDNDGSVRAGEERAKDTGDGATMVLPAGLYDFRFESTARVGGAPVELPLGGWYLYEVTANTNWGTVMDTPTILPTPEEVNRAEVAAESAEDSATVAAQERAAAQAARVDTVSAKTAVEQALQGAVADPTDVSVAGRIQNPSSQTAVALSAAYAAQEQVRKARWDATVRGVVVDDFSDLSRWAAAGGATLSQVTNEPGTPYAMRIVTASGVEAQFNRDFNADLRFKSLSFEIKLEDGNFDGLRLDLTVDGRSSTRQFARGRIVDATNTSAAKNVSTGVWKRVAIPAAFLSADAGSPTSITDVRVMRLKILPKAGTSASVLIRNMRQHDDALPPGVLFVFDDARLNTYDTAGPILESYGHRGIVPAVTGKLGTDLTAGVPLMSLAQLQEMETRGWEVVSHTHNHVTLAGQSLATVQAELRDSYNFLLANGFNKESAKMFVYPGGSWDEQARKEAIRHYRIARTIVDHRNQSAYITDPGLVETAYIGPATTVAQVKTALNQMVNRGGISILTFHSILPAGASLGVADWPEASFRELLDYTAALNLPSYKFRDAFPYDLPATGDF